MANHLSRFSPFRDIARFDPFRGFDDFFKDFRLVPALRDMEVELRIKMDITESDDAYTVKADMPGVSKEDIKISIEGNQVTISAEVKKEKEEKQGETVVHCERYVGQQYRSFTLPVEIDDAKAEAKYQNGVLELALPKKKTGNGSKQIAVS